MKLHGKLCKFSARDDGSAASGSCKKFNLHTSHQFFGADKILSPGRSSAMP